MARKQNTEPARYEGEQSEENEFDNIDSGDLSQDGSSEQKAETKEGKAIQLPVKTRERRKAPKVDEAAKIIRLMSYEDRYAVMSQVKQDLQDDIAKEQEEEEKQAADKQARIDRLKILKTGL